MYSDPQKSLTPQRNANLLNKTASICFCYYLDTHTQTERELEEAGWWCGGGLSNISHRSLPAFCSKDPTPSSWVVAMETASSPKQWRHRGSKGM